MESNLLSLPLLAREKILDELNAQALKNIRLVSKTTKEWVDQSKYKKKLRVLINSEEKQEKMIHTNSNPPPWESFIIQLKFEPLPKFLNKFGPLIKHLQLREVYGYRVEANTILDALNNSSNLETLVIDNLRFVPNKTNTAKIRLFENLKSLKIDQIFYYTDQMDENTSHWFDFILQSCPNLRYVGIPVVLYTGSRVTEDVYRQIVLEPLFNYLDNRKNNLNIDLNTLAFHENKCSMYPEGIMELFQKCSMTNTRLSNVPISFLPNKINFDRSRSGMFEKVVASIRILKIQDDVEKVYIPRTSQVHVNGIVNYTSQGSYELPTHTLTIHCDWDDFSPHSELELRNIFQIHRPRVENLHCKFNHYFETRQISSGIEMSSNFPNLRVLSLKSSTFGDTDYNDLLSGLLLLDTLSLIDCQNITDNGILGSDMENPIILKLKHLKHLKITSYFFTSTVNITDLSFNNAFKFMALKSFKLIYQKQGEPNEIVESPYTFQHGISSLTSIEGGFGDTIQTFEIKRPHDCSEGIFKDFLSRFKNLSVPSTGRECE